MAMTIVTCPTCETEGSMSFVTPDYRGPYACWKCHNLFDLVVKAGAQVSCTPMSQEDINKVKQTHPKTRGV